MGSPHCLYLGMDHFTLVSCFLLPITALDVEKLLVSAPRHRMAMSLAKQWENPRTKCSFFMEKSWENQSINGEVLMELSKLPRLTER